MEPNEELEYDGLLADPYVQQAIEANAEQTKLQQQAQQAEQTQAAQPEAAQPQQPQPEAQPEAQPEQPQEQYSPLQEGFDLGDGLRASAEGMAAIPLGAADFVSDVVGHLGFKAADKWWDENSPRSTNPWIKGIRDLSAVIVPSVILSRLGIKGVNKATAGAAIGPRTRVMGELALELGVDAAVVAASSSSGLDSDTNWGNQFENVFGISVPWAIREGDDADAMWAKNLASDTAIGGLLGMVSSIFALRKISKITKAGTDEVVETATDAAKAGDDEVIASIDAATSTKRNNEIDIGVEKLQEDPYGRYGYNSYVNVPFEDTSRPASGVVIDPLKAKVDEFRIQNNIGTNNGMKPPVVSDGFQKIGINNYDPAITLDTYIDIARKQSPKVDLIFKDNRFASNAIDASSEKLVDATQDLTVPFAEFKQAYNAEFMDGSTVIEGIRTLSSRGYKITAKTFFDVLDSLDPEIVKARTFAVSQAAEEVASNARAVDAIGDFADTSVQQERIFDKLEFMYLEMAFNRKGISELMRNLDVAKAGGVLTKADLEETATRIRQFRQDAVQESKKFRSAAEEVRKKNPEYYKPFIKVLQASNGDVNTLEKLRVYMKNRTGFFKKAAFDMSGRPDIPSYMVQNLQSIRYGNILMIRAPISAAIGNTINLGMKPVNMFAGTVFGKGDFREALWTFGGIQENFFRGLKAFREEWRQVTSSPMAAAKRQRKDFGNIERQMEDEFAMESFYAAEAKKGRTGGLMGYNLTKLFGKIANNNIMRFGANAMTSLDALTKSFIASGEARNRAYRALYEQMGKVSPKQFQELFDREQRKIYASMFDDSGMLKDSAALSMAEEITLQTDSKLADSLEALVQKAPVLKGIFMFPRTGINALKLSWSYAPGSAFMGGMTRHSKIVTAKSKTEILDALKEHGIKATDDNYLRLHQNLKQEYLGRQASGAAVITAAAFWALNGNLTGAGPRDQSLRRNMEKYQNWQAYSIRNPFDGEWVSYQGLEPFTSFLGLVADVVWEGSTRKDQQWTEDTLQKIGYSITSNISNKTFLSGFEPLTAMLAGDEGRWNAFLAREIDSFIPLTSARGVLNEIIAPQLVDVERDVVGYLAKRNKWLTAPFLAPQIDIYDGTHIRVWEPMQVMANAFTQFKVNSGNEPWRNYVTSIGWEGLSPKATNPISKQPMTPDETLWVNNWIGKNRPLKDEVLRIMELDESGALQAQVDDLIAKRRAGGYEQNELDIKRTVVHRMLDQHLQQTIKLAFDEMQRENPDMYRAGLLRSASRKAISNNDNDTALEYLKKSKELLGQ